MEFSAWGRYDQRVSEEVAAVFHEARHCESTTAVWDLSAKGGELSLDEIYELNAFINSIKWFILEGEKGGLFVEILG